MGMKARDKPKVRGTRGGQILFCCLSLATEAVFSFPEQWVVTKDFQICVFGRYHSGEHERAECTGGAIRNMGRAASWITMLLAF